VSFDIIYKAQRNTLIITTATVRPPLRCFNDLIVGPTARANPEWSTEGSIPFEVLMLSWFVMVHELPERRAKSIAIVHVGPKGVFAVIPCGEAGTLNLISAVKPLVPAFAAAVRRLRRWPDAIGTARVELIFVVSATANVPAATFPAHGIVFCIARVDNVLHRVDTFVFVECRNPIAKGDGKVVLFRRAYVVAPGEAPVDLVLVVIFVDVLAKLLIPLIGAVSTDVELTTGI